MSILIPIGITQGSRLYLSIPCLNCVPLVPPVELSAWNALSGSIPTFALVQRIILRLYSETAISSITVNPVYKVAGNTVTQ